MSKATEIIRYIRRNRVSTTEVADALGKTGVLPEVTPLTSDHFKVGRARCVFTAHNSNYALHEQLRHVKEDEIVLLFAHACDGRALLGDLIARYALLYRGAQAMIVDGLVRDASRLKRERYPIWARGATPLGCYNVLAEPFPKDLEADLRARYEGGVAVCDDGGVAVIGPDRLNADMLERLERIELQEDVWYYCLNTLKWDTKKIVCDKAYLKERGQLPGAYRAALKRLSSPLDAKKK